MIKMILCTDVFGAIGYKNQLLYMIREDLQNFKKLTLDHKIIMGYNTWESLPKKPLPKRENLILTSRDIDIPGATIIRDIDEIIKLGKDEDIFVIGGGQLYNEMINRDLVDEVYLTMVIDQAELSDTNVDIFEMGKNLQQREYLGSFIGADVDAHLYKYSRK